MAKKKPAVQPSANVLDGRVIDLLLPVLAELGISVERPRPDTLAGFIKGLLGDDVFLWSEIWGGDNEMHLQLADLHGIYEDQEERIRAEVERLNNFPEWGAGDERWLRVALSVPRRSGGGRNVMLIAIIRPLGGGELTPEFCEHIITVIVTFVKKEWPLR